MTLISRKLTNNLLIAKIQKKHSHGLRKQDINTFKKELGQIDWTDVLQTDDLEASCESFIGTVNTIKEKCNKPFKNRHAKSLPWFNEKLGFNEKT